MRLLTLAIVVTVLGFGALAAQAPIVTGDRSSPLRPVAGAGNVGVRNAVLRDQPEVRALRVVVEAGGRRAMHAHADVKFHLFVPISDAMTLDLDDRPSTIVPAWQPYYMKAGTQHGFHNSGASPVEIMEVFIRD